MATFCPSFYEHGMLKDLIAALELEYIVCIYIKLGRTTSIKL